MKKETVIFAVYGTLKSKHGNHRGRLNKAEFLGVFRTPTSYTLLDGGFPIVERGGDTSVEVELYKTDDENAIQSVFSLEGCDREQNSPSSWYTYDLLETPFGQATMFVMNEGRSGRNKKIESGVWGITREDIKEAV